MFFVSRLYRSGEVSIEPCQGIEDPAILQAIEDPEVIAIAETITAENIQEADRQAEALFRTQGLI